MPRPYKPRQVPNHDMLKRNNGNKSFTRLIANSHGKEIPRLSNSLLKIDIGNRKNASRKIPKTGKVNLVSLFITQPLPPLSLSFFLFSLKTRKVHQLILAAFWLENKKNYSESYEGKYNYLLHKLYIYWLEIFMSIQHN